MNQIEQTLQRFDRFQRRRKAVGFPVAVIKKYGDDQAGTRAALLTYYAFLSFFPLLMLLTTLTTNLVGSQSHLSQTIIDGVTNYFPLLGTQLATHVHSLHKYGLALAASILISLYGTRGVADSFRHGVQHIWLGQKSSFDTFPRSLFRSLGLVLIGGLGFLAASIISGIAAAAGHGLAFVALSVLLNIVMLFWLFLFLINFSLPRHVKAKELRSGAMVAATGLVILQLAGNYLLAHELKNLSALYSYFAVALSLMFWIYLQAQILYYAIEIAVVSSQRLFPRSLTHDQPTKADERLAALKSKNLL